jgi:hypothetical protein
VVNQNLGEMRLGKWLWVEGDRFEIKETPHKKIRSLIKL